MSNAAEYLLRCIIVTPQRPVAEQMADFVVFTAHDGQFGILPGRAPLICQLGCGLLRVDRGQDSLWYYVSGGFAEVSDNQVVVAANQAVGAGEIDVQQVGRELAELHLKKLDPQAQQRSTEQLKAKLMVAQQVKSNGEQ